jgi:hypothetical protein
MLIRFADAFAAAESSVSKAASLMAFAASAAFKLLAL